MEPVTKNHSKKRTGLLSIADKHKENRKKKPRIIIGKAKFQEVLQTEKKYPPAFISVPSITTSSATMQRGGIIDNRLMNCTKNTDSVVYKTHGRLVKYSSQEKTWYPRM